MERRIESEVYLRHDIENVLRSLALAHNDASEPGFYRALACMAIALHLNSLAHEFNELGDKATQYIGPAK